jgi:DNA-binding transcriptional LysR family regulator
MPLNLRHIEIFLDLADSLHFSNTAKRLKVPQPAVSRAITSLETELGVELFIRHTRSVSLTQAGEVFARQAGIASERFDRAVRMAIAAAEGRAGSLTIGFMEFAVEGAFPDLLKRFSMLYPQVSVRTLSSYTDRIIDDIEQDEIDIGFVVGPVARPGITAKTVQKDRFVAVLTKSHRLAGRDSVSLADLAGEAFVLGRRDTWGPYRERVDAICRRAGFRPRIVQEADWAESILAFVGAGLGISIYVERAFRLSPPGVCVKHLEDVDETVTTEMIWRAENRESLVENFTRLLQ